MSILTLACLPACQVWARAASALSAATAARTRPRSGGAAPRVPARCATRAACATKRGCRSCTGRRRSMTSWSSHTRDERHQANGTARQGGAWTRETSAVHEELELVHKGSARSTLPGWAQRRRLGCRGLGGSAANDGGGLDLPQQAL